MAIAAKWALVRGRARFLRKSLKAALGGAVHDCPICGYHGLFFPSGTPSIPDAGCPGCDSRPRHRLMALAVEKRGLLRAAEEPCAILHFAAERSLRAIIEKQRPARYLRADIDPARGDVVLDIEKLDVPDASYDVVICSHVLEHVDDVRALHELYRVLKPGGRLITMVPLIEGWDTTYENDAVQSWHERKVHFGGGTHIRYYGSDFRKRIESAGFVLSEFAATPEQTIRYALIAGERIFIGAKP